jgi:ketosteroid isomerase-like protein
MASFNSDLTLHSQNLEASGDLAYDSGDFQETLTNIAAGAKIESKASCVIIYKRPVNGAWQIVPHVWTALRRRAHKRLVSDLRAADSSFTSRSG